MGRINLLPISVANLIAAGEVVDRPASAVKELMENAIDAGATRVTVEIQHGGVTLMRVSDNGQGISPEDLPLAIKRHATSKIKEAKDLDAISTLGFRGEALAAIASVSDLRIFSKTPDAAFGAMLEVHPGKEPTVTEQGCPDGTTVLVENLFANIPARRKFLKKDQTEAMAVTANVEKIALSHPEVAFRLIIDGSVRLETAGDGNLMSAVYAVMGKEFSQKLISIEGENEGIKVAGLIGRTDYYKGNRNWENCYLNGRYVKSKTVTAAVEQAYTSYLPPERFPACVLFLTIDPSRVDVNVHPAKLEVKFSNEKPVFDAVYYTVRSALENDTTRPTFSLGQRLSEPQKPRVSEARVPVEDGKRESLSSRQLSYDQLGKVQRQPEVKDRMTAAEYRRLGRDEPHPKTPPTFVKQGGLNIPMTQTPPPPKQEAKAEKPVPKMPTETETPILPEYRIVGEVFHSYVIVEVGEKLLLIDKHAAHERILFEGLKANLAKAEVVSQMLLLPLEVMLTRGEVGALEEYRSELEKIGFAIEFGKQTLTVSAIPEGIESGAVADMLSTMAERILTGTGSVKLTRDILFEKALYQAACKAAIKAGREYADGHVEWIVGKLMELPDITFCPHGRPVAMELTHKTIDGQFDRMGF
ncbi:MAG: DNA mismatch repair endonuclease MutL [Clostridia bacterium]|nr:DNA mismatch repair endonuclease MutL [Clostridia bacterium]